MYIPGLDIRHKDAKRTKKRSVTAIRYEDIAVKYNALIQCTG